MDELLQDFLTETGESLDRVDAELVRFEQEPNNGQILSNIFRLVHTIKGTCGFLALSRLERLTHAAETLMGRFRDGMPVTADAVTLILSTLRPVGILIRRRQTPLRSARKLRKKPPTSLPTIRSASASTLDYLMTTVSELVLTRNQLLEIARRHEDSDFKVPLQRLSNVTAAQPEQ